MKLNFGFQATNLLVVGIIMFAIAATLNYFLPVLGGGAAAAISFGASRRMRSRWTSMATVVAGWLGTIFGLLCTTIPVVGIFGGVTMSVLFSTTYPLMLGAINMSGALGKRQSSSE